MITDAKKIFFLYPHKDTEETIIKNLVQFELESFPLHDHEILQSLLTFFDNSILFININSGPPRFDVYDYINKINGSPYLQDTQICAFQVAHNTITFEKELCTVVLPFFRLQMDREKRFVSKIAEICIQNEALGTRKIIRAQCREERRALFSIKENGEIIGGNIHDVSVCGMSGLFDVPQDLASGKTFNDIQLRLMDELISVKGSIIGYRNYEGRRLYVFMFTAESCKLLKSKISPFIYSNLQLQLKKFISVLNKS